MNREELTELRLNMRQYLFMCNGNICINDKPQLKGTTAKERRRGYRKATIKDVYAVLEIALRNMEV